MASTTSVRPWTEEEIRDFGYRVVDIIARHLTDLPTRPVVRPFPATIQESAMPEEGSPADDVLAEFAAQIEPYPFGNGHPRFWGWVNSPPTVIGVFAEALAAAMNPSCAGGDHAAIHVERQVIAWFRDLFRFPQDSMGLLVSGGSVASLTALAVARYAKAGFDVRREGMRESHAPLVIYQTREGHGCLQKSAEMLGLGSKCLRIVEHDSALRMIPAALDAAITADLAAGRIPMAVVASAGSVNTGAIDPLEAIAEVCRRHNLWLHADGAYGAPAMLTSRYREPLAALSLCDSVVLDPHKWLYVPVEAGSAHQRRNALAQ